MIRVALLALLLTSCSATTGAPGPHIPQPQSERDQCIMQRDLPWC